MDTPNPKPSRTASARPLTRLWNWLCRRGRRPQTNPHPIPPICYDME